MPPRKDDGTGSGTVRPPTQKNPEALNVPMAPPAKKTSSGKSGPGKKAEQDAEPAKK